MRASLVVSNGERANLPSITLRVHLSPIASTNYATYLLFTLPTSPQLLNCHREDVWYKTHVDDMT